jgi:hypothetical protein
MGRTFSLRGKIAAADERVEPNKLVFEYASPDRTKGWRVKEAYIWPVNWHGIAHVGDGFMNLSASLQTDSRKLFHDTIVDPTENRCFAWAQQNYNHRDGPINFITPNGFPLNQARFLVDPDHVLTNSCYLSVATASDVDQSVYREWGYLIILEEMKLTPTESVFQQIKGIGQNIDN